MRGVVFRGGRRLEIMTFDDPTPRRNEVVVEMKASGMCGSDLHYYRGDPVAMMKARGEASLAAREIGRAHV